MEKFSKKIIEAAAKAAWDANKAHCDAIGEAQPTWEDAPDILKKSVRSGVRSVIENPDMTPEASHEKWMAYKAAEGWVYGETKDVEAKTHPCMIPYAELPESQRVKDDIFQTAVRGVLWPAPEAPPAPTVRPSGVAIGTPVLLTIKGNVYAGTVTKVYGDPEMLPCVDVDYEADGREPEGPKSGTRHAVEVKHEKRGPDHVTWTFA